MKMLKFIIISAIISVFIYIAVEDDRNIGTVFSENRTIEITPPKDLPEAHSAVQDDEDYLSSLLQVVYAKDEDEQAMEIQKTGLFENHVDDAGGETVKIVISAAGDCTLGSDDKYSYDYSFMHEYEQQNKDSGYYFKNVAHIFRESDLSIVNLEGPLTNSVTKADKEFAFKGLPEFTDILKSGNIDAVAIANNHIKDYLTEGYNDTISHLEDAEIMYFGNEYTALTEIKGVKIGMLGYSAWYVDNGIKNNIVRETNKLRERGADIIIAYFHWGDESAKYPNDTQKHYARFAIDNGVDLVLGSHPHVIQGVEEYKGKQIVYSFGNFCFGGNRNPSDKDTYIFQQTFTFYEGKLQDDQNIRIIPASVSSVTSRNNFQPTPYEGDERERVARKIIERSLDFNTEEALRRALGMD